LECELCEFVLKVFDSEMIKNSTEVSVQGVVGVLHAVHVIACEYTGSCGYATCSARDCEYMYIQEFAGNCAVYMNTRSLVPSPIHFCPPFLFVCVNHCVRIGLGTRLEYTESGKILGIYSRFWVYGNAER
jgi:hypothetical protein